MATTVRAGVPNRRRSALPFGWCPRCNDLRRIGQLRDYHDAAGEFVGVRGRCLECARVIYEAAPLRFTRKERHEMPKSRKRLHRWLGPDAPCPKCTQANRQEDEDEIKCISCGHVEYLPAR